MDDAERARLLLAAQLATVGSLAGALIHEINNNTGFLALVSAQLEKTAQRALDAGVDVPAEQVLSFAQGIVESAKHARDHVASFQAVAGFTRGALAGSVDVRKILLSALALTKTAHRSKATIEASIDELLPPCPPSFARLGPAVAALLLNALQATPPENQPHSVTLSASVADQALLIEVTNTGSQPATQPLEELFEPFKSERPTEQAAGLGLFLVEQTVRRLDGTCTITAGEQGTRVSLRVPLPD